MSFIGGLIKPQQNSDGWGWNLIHAKRGNIEIRGFIEIRLSNGKIRGLADALAFHAAFVISNAFLPSNSGYECSAT